MKAAAVTNVHVHSNIIEASGTTCVIKVTGQRKLSWLNRDKLLVSEISCELLPGRTLDPDQSHWHVWRFK